MEKQNHHINWGLENPELKQPYGSVPDGYWASLEAAVQDRIHSEEAPADGPMSLWERTKSHVFLALSFCIIMGFGYGVMWLTGTMDQQDSVAGSGSWDLSALVEEGYIRSTAGDPYFSELLEREGDLFDGEELLLKCVDSDEANEMISQLNQMEIMDYLYE